MSEHRYICKGCGAESPSGIGYIGPDSGPLPAPAPGCPNQHVERKQP